MISSTGKRKTRDEELEGAVIDDRLVRHIAQGERVVVSEGKLGEERVARIIESNGTVTHYEGPKGAERLWKVEAYASSSGFRRICRYQGEKGQERLVSIEHSNGHITHYNGPKDQEYKEKVVFKSGNVLYFKGEKRKEERKVKQIDKDGTVTFFRGEPGAEYYWAVLHPLGEYHLYTGPKGYERLFRVVDPGGAVTEFRNLPGLPAPSRERRWEANGTMVDYSGSGPLDAMRLRNVALGVKIRTALERAESLHEKGDCKENCYLAMCDQLKLIHEAATSLFEAATAGHASGVDHPNRLRFQRLGEHDEVPDEEE